MPYFTVGGRARLRVREVHAQDHLAPLLSRGAVGTVKVDLLLRGLARPGGGQEEPGRVPYQLSWDHLHDLVRPRAFYGDAAVLKRKWMSDKLEQLEDMGLLHRERRAGRRPVIVMLRDDGSSLPYDDPGATADSYVTVLGSLFETERITSWGAPQIAAYLAAMIAERLARADPAMAHLEADRPFGGGIWFRPLNWFADDERSRPVEHIRIPFSTRTLRRGIELLRSEHLIASRRIHEDPRTGRPFATRYGRYLYFNGFDDVRPGSAPSFAHGYYHYRLGPLQRRRHLRGRRIPRPPSRAS